VVIVCASFWGGEQARSSIDVIEKTRESQLGVERLLTLLEGAEARQRGFLLTGDEKYLTHFEQAATALEASFGNVTGLAGENPARRRQLDEMGLRIIDVLSQLRATIALSRTGGPEAAIAAIGSGGVAMLLDEIRAIVDTMNSEQEAILDRLGERQESILLLVRIAELFGIVILAIAGMTLTQQATQTMNALKSARESDAAATAAATAANRSKSDFLASMSHEIRTPLNGVLGNLELLAQSDLKPAQEDLLFDADKAAKSLLALIGNVLDFSKI
jgi:CHASE3 domain sensor protein